MIPGHIVVHGTVCTRLKLTYSQTLCRLRVVGTDPVPVNQVTLSVGMDTVSVKQMQHIRHHFYDWVCQLRHPVALMNKSDIELRQNNSFLQCTLELQFSAHISSAVAATAAVAEEMSIGTHVQYAVFGADHHLLPDIIQVRTVDLLQQQQPTTCANPFDRLRLAGVQSTVKASMKNLSPIVSRRVAAMRLLLGTPAPGSIVIHGPRGCGKTMLLRAISQMYRQHIESLCHVEFVSCRSLRGLKMAVLKQRLSGVFDAALRHAPSVSAPPEPFIHPSIHPSSLALCD